jgi:hypothetical protein
VPRLAACLHSSRQEQAVSTGSERRAAADQKERRELLRMALRGRRLIIAPAGAGSPAERAEVTRRIRIE